MVKTFTVVHIPAELSKPMAELEVEIPPGKEIECLTNRLKLHFAQGGGSSSSEAEREMLREQLQKSVPEGTNIDESMLSRVMQVRGSGIFATIFANDFSSFLQMGSLVDTVPLVMNTKDASFIGINIYVDDRGTAKGLPLNQRATAVAQQCHRL